MTRAFSWQNSVSLFCFILYSKTKLACCSRDLLTTSFCILIPYDEKNIFFHISSRRSCRSSENHSTSPLLVTQLVKHLLAMWEPWAQSLGWEDPLEKRTATHSSVLAWRTPGNCIGSQRVGHDWVAFTFLSLIEVYIYSSSDVFELIVKKALLTLWSGQREISLEFPFDSVPWTRELPI